ncbi:hypothetical protein M3Y94_00610100 [Aphelenchoides besseyi]|nr:hypothetical protein M3Y94_00610100 [Aphelenchoides besseyi]KAI6216935.1 hypothetical protein M3Y95_01249100 [Aphelenchoides besseyi]
MKLLTVGLFLFLVLNVEVKGRMLFYENRCIDCPCNLICADRLGMFMALAPNILRCKCPPGTYCVRCCKTGLHMCFKCEGPCHYEDLFRVKRLN